MDLDPGGRYSQKVLHEVPPWCRWRRGDGRFLVVAPHGGICRQDLVAHAEPLRGNDLHTAELADEIATRLSAALISNLDTDRNRLDLNRISEVEREASWFLALMRRLLEETLDRHRRAEVLFVHGWHVVQPKCDLGVGARLLRAEDARHVAPRLSITPDYATGRLEALRAACAAHGIAAGYGERWPAAHPNNVMRLFRRTPPAAGDGPAAALARLAASGRVEAVQIELGAALRWPGRWRERFVAALVEAFADPVPGRARTAPARRAREAAPSRRAPRDGGPGWRALALQAHDPAAGGGGLGIVVGLGTIGRDEVGARLLLLPGGQRLLLFTGHARLAGQRADRPRVGGLEAVRADGALEIRFLGPMLDIPDGSLYFRRERAQLDARVVDVELRLRFAATERPYGGLAGEVAAGEESWRVATHGFADPVLGRPAPGEHRARTRLTAAFAADLGLVADVAPGVARVSNLGGAGEELEVDAGWRPLALEPDRLCDPFALALRGRAPLSCEPRSHLTIVRPVPGGGRARVTFGLAAFRLGEELAGSGFYEHAVAIEPRLASGAAARDTAPDLAPRPASVAGVEDG